MRQTNLSLLNKIINIALVITIISLLAVAFYNSRHNQLQDQTNKSEASSVSTDSSSSQSSISSKIKIPYYESTISNIKYNNKELKSYTNELFPGLQINFDKSWNVKMEKPEKDYDDLFNGTLILSKTNQELKISLYPYGSTGFCNRGYGDKSIVGASKRITSKEKIIVTDKIYREMFQFDETKDYPFETFIRLESAAPSDAFEYYSKPDKNCAFGLLESKYNFQTPSYVWYSKTNKMLYEVGVSYKGDPSTFDQADQILKDSIIPTYDKSGDE